MINTRGSKRLTYNQEEKLYNLLCEFKEDYDLEKAANEYLCSWFDRYANSLLFLSNDAYKRQTIQKLMNFRINSNLHNRASFPDQLAIAIIICLPKLRRLYWSCSPDILDAIRYEDVLAHYVKSDFVSKLAMAFSDNYLQYFRSYMQFVVYADGSEGAMRLQIKDELMSLSKSLRATIMKIAHDHTQMFVEIHGVQRTKYNLVS